MKICAIVAEFNPFHNGHAYLINKAYSLGYTHIVIVMSGNFVQRGEPSIISKEARASIALQNGANLVLEIPTIKSVSTAERYAYFSLEIIKHLGCVDSLIFGSECGNINRLSQVQKYIDDKKFGHILKKHLDNGLNFAVAREKTIHEISGNFDISSILQSPNNILGVEYLRAIKELNLKLGCITFERTKNSEYITSASEIRNMIINGNNEYKKYVPESSIYEVESAIKNNTAPVDIFFSDRTVLSKLRSLSLSEISSLPDISEGLDNRIYKYIRESTSLEELLFKIKTKRYTMSRIKRIILSAFLGINSEMTKKPIEYLKVLGTDSRGLEILKIAKNTSTVPIITRYNQLNNLPQSAKEFFELESNFTDIYNTLTPNILPCGVEKKFKLIKR